MKLVKYLLVVVIAMGSRVSWSAQEEECFPRAKRVLSPSGAMAVSSEEADKVEHTYDVFLEPSHRKLLSFEGFACAHWAPSEDFLAITQRVGSDWVDLWVFSVNSPGEMMDVTDYLPKKLAALLKRGGHRTVFAKGWSAEGLLVGIQAAGEWGEFDKSLVCRFGGKKPSCRVLS